jgi:DNA mismatch repair protein MutL
MDTGCEIQEEIEEALALALAQKAAITAGKTLSDDESASLVARLFSSASPNYTPDGKPIVSIFSEEELAKRF